MTALPDMSAKTGSTSPGFKAGNVLSPAAEAISVVINNQPGGTAGLLARFESAGLQEQLSAWVGEGKGTLFTVEQVTKALGPEAIKALASKLNVDSTEAIATAVQELPLLLKQFAPAGSAFANKLLKH